MNIEKLERIKEAPNDVDNKILYQQTWPEVRYLTLVNLYAHGLSRLLLAYYKYIFEELFTGLVLPKAIEKFRKRHHRSKVWLGVSVLGLLLNIIGFYPDMIVGWIMGVGGIIMWGLENKVWSGKDLDNLKLMPNLASIAEDEISRITIRIELIRAVKDFILTTNFYLPDSTAQVIKKMKTGEEVRAQEFLLQDDILSKKFDKLKNTDWPGLGFYLKDDENPKQEK